LDENKTDLAQNGILSEELKNLAKTIELQAREQMAFLDSRDKTLATQKPTPHALMLDT
jgi:hypothetical protein